MARSLQVSSEYFEDPPLNATSANALQSSENPFLAAALAALADLPAPEPVPAISMLADGHLLIIGELEVALGWAERLAGQREVTVLALGEPPATVDRPDAENFALEFGNKVQLSTATPQNQRRQPCGS